MKVIFRSNDHFAKKTLGQLGGAEEWLCSLNEYLSEDAIARLSLFIESNGVSLATLDIVDGSIHVYSTVKDVNEVTAVESVIDKCLIQLKKNKVIANHSNETIRYKDDYYSYIGLQNHIILNPEIMDQFSLLDVIQKLENEKKTPKYNHVMNKYISYLFREKDIERAEEHLRILYSILDNADLEEISFADYQRLTQSVVQIEKERNSMLNKQRHFEETKDKLYIDQIIKEETRLVKLKK